MECVRAYTGGISHAPAKQEHYHFNCLFCVCFGILKLAYEQAHMRDFGENFGDNFCKEIIPLSVVLFLPA